MQSKEMSLSRSVPANPFLKSPLQSKPHREGRTGGQSDCSRVIKEGMPVTASRSSETLVISERKISEEYI